MQLTSSQPAALESLSVGAGRSLTSKGLASGLKLGDEAILHAGLFADIGYDSNVFYSVSGSDQTAPVLHVTPRLELTNAERDGSIPSGTYYDLVGSVDFLEYLSSNSQITSQNAINPMFAGSVELSPGQALSLALTENFSRSREAPYVAGAESIIRDDNMASATLRYAPGGGRLKLMLRYSNLIDKYEGSYDIGSNMGNEGVLDLSWRWLPKTSLYAQAAQGFINYFNSAPGNYSSHPLRTLLGIRGLLTEKVGVNVGAGYSDAFYSGGINSPSGFSGNVGIVAEVNYVMSLLSRAGLGYHHDFVNSPFLGTYYNMDAVYGSYQQLVASRLMTYLYGRYENRRFGPVAVVNTPSAVITNRTDNNVVFGAAVDYMIGKFLMLGASYSLSLNRTASGADPTLGPLNYTKHVVLFRVGVAY